ncbi:Mu DNA-binding domain [Leminorella richardii]|uniref:Mu DNA-binding domain n=2 Tax=Leminorella richardii TaxID=158841 RepID=A0A2X4V9Q0_9GAMM|nr:DNA-binding protein [Leminorella richardii]SQI43452.1 Mu DNA-binding domain [Leminorella richardii]
MKKEWFSTHELTRLDGLPSTIQGINQKARREHWKSRKRVGVQGKALEYHIDSVPEKVRAALFAKEESDKYGVSVGMNDPLVVWVTAYNQLTVAERERLISLIVRDGITGLMERIGLSTDIAEAAQV